MWGAPSPLCRGGQWPPGAGKVPPCRGRSPSGGKDHFFFCGKRNGPSPQRKRGGRSTVGLGLTTAAFVFTHCLGTSPGRYGHPMVEQGKDGGSIWPPPTCATLPAECGKSPPAAGRHPTTPARREVTAGGGRLGRRPAPIPQGQAVTAGRGPFCHTKAASRRFPAETHRRPGPTFSLESRPVSFSAEKEMDLAPAGQAPPGGTPPPGALAPAEKGKNKDPPVGRSLFL